MTRRSWRQEPQLEGELDEVLLSGVALKPQRFVEVTVSGDEGPVTLHAGSLQGVTAGSVYALHAPNTKDFDATKPVAEASVQSTTLGTASLALTADSAGKVKLTDLQHSRAVERQHAYGDNRLKVDLDHLKLFHPQGRLLWDRVSHLEVVAPASGHDEVDVRVMCRGKDPAVDRGVVGLKDIPQHASWLVVRRDGSILGAFPEDNRMEGRITRALEDEARWRTIIGLSNKGATDPFKVELKVVPVEVTKDSKGYVTGIVKEKPLTATDGNRVQVNDGEYFTLKIRVNKDAPWDPYIAILDLWPDGRVTMSWPLDEKPDKTQISADGEWYLGKYPYVWKFEIPKEPRYGQDTYNPAGRAEVFKVFATRTYVPMNLVTDPESAKGLKGKGLKGWDPRGGPLAEIIRAAVAGQRAERVTVAPEYWSTTAAYIDIAARP